MDEKLGKAYKLCSKKAIESIFTQKKTVKQFPFVMHYSLMELPSNKSFQFVISAPKKLFRHAHDRNRIKRLTKEVIRKNKLILEQHLTTNEQQLALFIVYTSKEELKYEVLNKKISTIFQKVIEEIKN